MEEDKKPERNISLESVAAFRELGIGEQILQALAEMGFTEPTEIQKKTIRPVLAGQDVIARAATGSGKTLAFGSAIIQNTVKKQGIQALVLTPTRELAIQARKALKDFSRHKGMIISSVYGGVSIHQQIKHLKNSNVVVATPGRLLDHINRKTIDLSLVKILVLDEADRMLDMGFLPDVQKIINHCPSKRQTLLFSATLDPRITRLAQRYMNDPLQVFAESYVDPSKLKQIYYSVQDYMKFSLLAHLLKNEQSHLVMVFCNTRHKVDFVAKNLNTAGIRAIAIHGGFKQSKRTKTMDSFQSQNVNVLVCTDVAARGLDIPHVSHIYNYDTPDEEDKYIHRIGRTARAGKEGKVINIIGQRDHANFRIVQNRHNVKISREETPQFPQLQTVKAHQKQFRPGGGRRGHPRRNKPYQQRHTHHQKKK